MPMKTLKTEQTSAKPKKSMALFPVRVSTMDAELQGFELPCLIILALMPSGPPDERLTDQFFRKNKVNIKKSYGRDLFDLVCRTIGLRETWYFGLQYVDSEGIPMWLRLDKKILNQDVPKEVPLNFTFLVKFYPEDVSSELIQEITQHLFYLQVKQSILNMDIYCPPEAAVLLASYAAQAELEDYDETKFDPSMLRMEDLLPQRVMDQFQMTPEMWADKIKIWYSDHIGLSREEAEMEYLKIVQDLHMFGISYFQITNKKKTELWLGVDSRGLNVYEENDKLSPRISFPWSEIKNISYRDKKFTIKHVNKKAPDFIFFAPKLKINKIILELCVGNHELFMRRRKPDTMEIQAMKQRAKELKVRKEEERKRMLREKQLREEALQEKEEAERKFLQLQEEFCVTQEALIRSEKTSDLLADKAKLVEEEVMLLRQKAEKAEGELQHMKVVAMKTEEEKGQMERRARELEVITIKIMEECSRRTRESEMLKEELVKARMAERAAQERQLELARSPHSHMSYERGSMNLSNDLSEMMVSELGMDGESGDASDMGQLSLEIEKERMEYMEKSKNLHDHLKELKSEIEGMKVEENKSHYDQLHEEKMNAGDTKYSTLLKVKSGTTKARVAFFEEL